MASSKIWHDIIGDVTECPICTEVIVDSKVLPCIHTFCLKCLEQFWKDKKPGDGVSCPLCRTPFNIPERGLSDLPKNCFVEKLVDAQKLSNTNQSFPTCDICYKLKNKANEVLPPAVKYCVDCKNNICEQCAMLHSVFESLNQHNVVKLGEVSTLDTMNYALKQCNQHKDEKIKIYCLDCETAVCQTCFIIKHNGHKCSDINEVTQGLKDQIRKNLEKTKEMFLKVNEQSGNLEKVLKGFEHDTKETEIQIVRRGDEIKQLVDKHVQSLLLELIEEKTKKLKEFENVREELQVQKVSLESFTKYSQKIIDKANPSDIACFATELRTRADNLSKMRTVPVGERVEVSFVPFDLNVFTDGNNARNIVGKTSFSGQIPSDLKPSSDTKTNFNGGFLDASSTIRNQNTILGENLQSSSGIAISDKEIFIIQNTKPGVVQVFDYDTFKHLKNLRVPALQSPWDITFSGNILFVAEFSSGLIHRIPLDSSEPRNSWSVGEERIQLSILKSGNILVTCFSPAKLFEYTTTGQLVRDIPLPQDITKPRHAIQMDNDRFLVCHVDSVSRVCLIDNNGKLIKSYGGAHGSGPGQLNSPHHLIADVNGSCLVADYNAHRIILLNDELQFVKELIPQSSGLKNSFRMCLDRNWKKLFVAEYNENGRVVVFDILP